METVYSVPKNQNYTRRELEKLTIPSLKNILSNKNLKVSGKKEELINRILQPQITYFDILPGDIKRELDYYQGETNIYNQFIRSLNESFENMLMKWPEEIESFNRLFKEKNLDIKAENIDGKIKVTMGRLKNIEEDTFIDILMFILKPAHISILPNVIQQLNGFLKTDSIPLRIVQWQLENKTGIEIIKGKIKVSN